jgi:hypothetical protein
MMLCDIAISYIKRMPDEFEYKHFIFQFFKHVMTVVDENESILDIESKISSANTAEDLIQSLHSEITLLQKIVNERLWVEIEMAKKEVDYKEFFFMAAAFRDKGHPAMGPFESTKHKKNERPERPPTAGYSEKKREEDLKH